MSEVSTNLTGIQESVNAMFSDDRRSEEVVSLLKDERCNYSDFLRGSGERNPLQDAWCQFSVNRKLAAKANLALTVFEDSR